MRLRDQLSVTVGRAPEAAPLILEAALTIRQRRIGQQVITRFRRDLAFLERKHAPIIEKALRDLGVLVADTFVAVAPADLVIEAASDSGRDDELSPAVKAAIADTIRKAPIKEWMNDRLDPAIREVWRETIVRTVRSVNAVTKLNVGLPDPVTRKILDQGGTNLGLKDFKQQARVSLTKSLKASRDAGEGVEAAARRIRANVPAGPFPIAGPKYRAKLIARTETLNAQRISSLEAYKTSENIDRVQAFDGDSDPDCLARNGRVFTIEDAENETEHPNGTLNWAPLVRGMEPPGGGRPTGKES